MSYPTGGLIAILRGVTPETVVETTQTLYDEGFRSIEIPLNSPEPLRSIERARAEMPDDCLIGAGTVLSTDDVAAVADAGGQFMVSPNCDPDVIAATVQRDLGSYPGVATPTEALRAIDAGATAIKIFPAIQVTSAGLGAWAAILPPHTGILPVGGVGPDQFAEWMRVGATGFGLGSALYKPSFSRDEIASRAAAMVATWRSLNKGVEQ